MSAVVSAISWAIAKVFGDNVLRLVAYKAIAVALTVIILPIILNNLVYDIIEIMFGVVADNFGSMSGIGGSMVNITGVGAYLMEKFRLPECFSIIVSALTVRASLNMIPFLRF